MDQNQPIKNILTIREIEVLKLVCEGYQNKKIALLLSIEERTVRFHMENIFKKLDVHSRTQAILMAVHNRWFRA